MSQSPTDQSEDETSPTPFEQVYRDHLWGGDEHAFFSGTGSHSPTIVAPYVEAIRAFLRRFPAPPNVVDLGCGDFNVGSQLRDLCGQYTACDVVPDLIGYNRTRYADLNVDFRVHDLRTDTLPTCDVLFIRQVLQHLSNADIARGLERIRGRCRFLVVTEHVPSAAYFPPNQDKPSGASIRVDFGSGVVLTEAPFDLARESEELLCEVPEYDGWVRTIAYGLDREAVAQLQLAPAVSTSSDEIFVLMTHHGSWVTLTPEGTALSHSMPDRDYGEPIVFRKSDGRVQPEATFSCLHPAQAAALSRLEIAENVPGTPYGSVVLRDGTHVLSAEPATRDLVPRAGIAEWEIYRKRHLKRSDLASLSGLRAPIWRRGTQIPKLLHQTYPTAEVPEAIAPSVAALRARHPDYTYRLWTDAEIPDFIHDHYGRAIRDAYLRINPVYGAARADVFRYLMVYRLGGVYLDIKSSTAKPLGEVLQPTDQFLLSQWGDNGQGAARWWGEHPELYNVPGGEFQQWFVIASPGHVLLERVINRVLANIETYDPRYSGVGKMAVVRLTGPIAYTLAILPELGHGTHRWFDANRDLVYSSIERHGVLFPTHYSVQDQPVILAR
jgi:inositol phosphorylceramide mannosyltransferase catalytic subunit